LHSLCISALLRRCFELLLIFGIQCLHLGNFLLCLPLNLVGNLLSLSRFRYPLLRSSLVPRSRLLRLLFRLNCFCLLVGNGLIHASFRLDCIGLACLCTDDIALRCPHCLPVCFR